MKRLIFKEKKRCDSCNSIIDVENVYLRNTNKNDYKCYFSIHMCDVCITKMLELIKKEFNL